MCILLCSGERGWLGVGGCGDVVRGLEGLWVVLLIFDLIGSIEEGLHLAMMPWRTETRVM